jgi:hypothetical protein
MWDNILICLAVKKMKIGFESPLKYKMVCKIKNNKSNLYENMKRKIIFIYLCHISICHCFGKKLQNYLRRLTVIAKLLQKIPII